MLQINKLEKQQNNVMSNVEGMAQDDRIGIVCVDLHGDDDIDYDHFESYDEMSDNV